MSYQSSGLSITELLMKADIDANSQRELEYKLNEVTTQLQNETYSLFGKDEIPKKQTIQNINEIRYGVSKEIKSPYTDKSRPSMNPERNIQP